MRRLQERIRTVPVPQFVEVLKDKVEVVYEHKYVDVPQVLLQDEVVEQPVVQVVEKIVQVPKPVYVEKIVEVPRTQHRPVSISAAFECASSEGGSRRRGALRRPCLGV